MHGGDVRSRAEYKKRGRSRLHRGRRDCAQISALVDLNLSHAHAEIGRSEHVHLARADVVNVCPGAIHRHAAAVQRCGHLVVDKIRGAPRAAVARGGKSIKLAYTFFAHACALALGIPGDYIRFAHYFMTLRS